MALTIIAGDPIDNRDNGRLWFAQNGAKRTRLSLYAAQGVHIERFDTEVYVARNAVPVWYSPDWREASVYLQLAEDDELHVVWLNSHCGFDVIPQAAEKHELHAVWLNTHCGFAVVPKDAVLWEASSFGGPKNSESKIAVLKTGCYVKEYTYKRATPSEWFAITLDGAVRCLGEKSRVIALALRGDKDAKRLAEFKGWLSDLTGELEVQDEL